MNSNIVFMKISIFWNNIGTLSYYNRSLIELLFILLYATEQMGLVYFVFTAANKDNLTLIVSMFTILVLTTFAIHKLSMESRIRRLEKKSDMLIAETQNMGKKYGRFKNKWNLQKQL